MHQNKSKPIHILHIENEKEANEITRLFLKKTMNPNFQIIPSLNANDALEKLKSKSFDIIISDYKMPGMDGIKFFKKIQEMNIEMPFILFIGKYKHKIKSETLSLGKNKYLKKVCV